MLIITSDSTHFKFVHLCVCVCVCVCVIIITYLLLTIMHNNIQNVVNIKLFFSFNILSMDHRREKDHNCINAGLGNVCFLFQY